MKNRMLIAMVLTLVSGCASLMTPSGHDDRLGSQTFQESYHDEGCKLGDACLRTRVNYDNGYELYRQDGTLAAVFIRGN